MSARPRQRVSRYLERHVFNPQLRLALHLGLAPRNFALLETIGRRTGIRRQTPVGNGLDRDTFWLVAEHGRRCAYVHNLVAHPRVRVKAGGEWRAGTANLVPEENGYERRRLIDSRNAWSGRFDGWIFTKTATQPMTIRIDLDPLG